MARISIVAALLLLCGSGYHAPRQRHECYAIAVVAAAAKERTTLLTPSKHQQRSKKMKLSVETSYQQDSAGDDRQVIPWVSIAVLLNILFFFRSFAAPFFDPLVSWYVWNAHIIALNICISFWHIPSYLTLCSNSGRTSTGNSRLSILFITLLPLHMVSISHNANSPTTIFNKLQYYNSNCLILLYGIR